MAKRGLALRNSPGVDRVHQYSFGFQNNVFLHSLAAAATELRALQSTASAPAANGGLPRDAEERALSLRIERCLTLLRILLEAPRSPSDSVCVCVHVLANVHTGENNRFDVNTTRPDTGVAVLSTAQPSGGGLSSSVARCEGPGVR